MSEFKHELFHASSAARCRVPWDDLLIDEDYGERARTCPTCNALCYDFSELDPENCQSLVLSTIAKGQPNPKLFRRVDGTFTISGEMCHQSEIHDPWCSFGLVRGITFTLLASAAALGVLGMSFRGVHHYIGFLAVPCKSVLLVGLLPAALCASVVFWLQRTPLPKRAHPCYWYSFMPILVGFVDLSLLGCRDTILPITLIRYLPYVLFLISICFCAFCSYLYKGKRGLFVPLMLCSLWVQYVCLTGVESLLL